MECLGIPLVGSIAEHKTLVSSTKLALRFVSVNRCGDIGILCMDVCDHLTVGTVESNLLTSVANLAADITSDLLEVHLLCGDVSLAKKHDLKKTKHSFRDELSSVIKARSSQLTMPVLVAVSMATLASGLMRMQASSTPSEI